MVCTLLQTTAARVSRSDRAPPTRSWIMISRYFRVSTTYSPRHIWSSRQSNVVVTKLVGMFGLGVNMPLVPWIFLQNKEPCLTWEHSLLRWGWCCTYMTRRQFVTVLVVSYTSLPPSLFRVRITWCFNSPFHVDSLKDHDNRSDHSLARKPWNMHMTLTCPNVIVLQIQVGTLAGIPSTCNPSHPYAPPEP